MCIRDRLSFFPKNAAYYFSKPDIPRGLDQKELREKSKEYDLLGDDYESVKEAYQAALNKAKSNDLVYVGGSTFVVAEVI